MVLDLDRAMYSHCEQAPFALCSARRTHLDQLVQGIVGAPVRRTRLVTYLQGALTLTDADVEFRAHVWFDLPQGHPCFPFADRGLAWLLRAIDRDGLHGAVLGGLGWLGRPIEGELEASGDDWVSQMIAAQGYVTICGAEWQEPLEDHGAVELLDGLLGRHLVGMTNHLILEQRLERRPTGTTLH